MTDSKGKLIVLYGINNIGKTTQTNLLVDRLLASGKEASRAKAPLYNMKPSGPMINEYLREDNPQKLSPREAQMLYAFNRIQYQEELLKKLEGGEWIVFEDYWATSVAWGGAAGVPIDFLIELNSCIHPPNLNILMTGNRFLSGVEVKHKHERNKVLIEKAEKIFKEMGEKYRWPEVNANQSIEAVHEDIWKIVEEGLILTPVV
ncbi:MAG: hypothetical protein AAB903_00225 [Patescibacteria group bacterium]